MLGNTMKMANRKMKWAIWDSFFSLCIQINSRRECLPYRDYSVLNSVACAVWRKIAWLSPVADISKSPKLWGFVRRKSLGRWGQGTFSAARLKWFRRKQFGSVQSLWLCGLWVSHNNFHCVPFRSEGEKTGRKIRFQTCPLMKSC